MGKFIDMTGWKMWEHDVPDSRLTVIEQTEKNGKLAWRCQCECGNVLIADGKRIRSGNTKSCGCLRKDVARESVKKVQDLAAKAASKSNKKYNKFILNLEDKYGLYGIGITYNTNREFYFDMDDYDKIKDICWNEQIKGISILQGRDLSTNCMVRMHSYLGYKNYDHIDRNELNNRKYNLRPATAQENARNHSKQRNNTSGFTGVSWDKQSCKWKAFIYVNKKQIHLGLFTNQINALKTRLQAELEYFGVEFAPQRHLFNEYNIIDKEGES